MSESSSTSGSRTWPELARDRGSALPVASCRPRTSSGSRGDARESSTDSCCIERTPDALLAAILQFLPQKERIQVASLVCKRWLKLIRSRLCQIDTTIHVFPALLAHLQQLPPDAQRAAIKNLAAFGRYAKLIINPQEPLHPSRHGGPSQFSVLRALLLELREVRSINISIRCPVGARLLGGTFAGVLQRSAETLVTLEIWGNDLADATLAALFAAAPSPWERFSSQRREIGEAFLSAAAALEVSGGPHRLRSKCRDGSGTKKNVFETCRGMLTATAQILNQLIEPTPPCGWSQCCGQTACNSQQQQQHFQQQHFQQQHPYQRSRCSGKDSDSSRPGKARARCCRPRWEATCWRDRRRGAMSRRDLRRRISEIENCCCCLAAVETALQLRRSFQHIRLLLPQLTTLAVGSWLLLQVLHCPCLEELKLASNTSARQHDAGSRQQQQQQQFLQHSAATGEGAAAFSGSIGPTGAAGNPEYATSALQPLLVFLLRCGSNLRQLQGFYPVGAVNEALLQPVSMAGASLCGTIASPAGTGANVSSRATAKASAPAPPAASAPDTRWRRPRDAFIAAAMAAADAIIERPTGTYSPDRAPDTSQASGLVRGALNVPRGSSGYNPASQLSADSSVAPGTADTSSFVKAIAVAHEWAAKTASLPLEAPDSIAAAAAALCACVGDGCCHYRHSPGGCCALPCVWGHEGELLLVLLPRLRVAQISDFLLLGLLLLPRLEELRMPDTWDTAASNPTAGFALLWAYLGTYGVALRALETKGTAPPLAAFLGSGTTAEPLPSSVRPPEAEATKALRLLLRIHSTHPLMDPAFPSVGEKAAAALRPGPTAAPAPAATGATAEGGSAIAVLRRRTVGSSYLSRTMTGHRRLDSREALYGYRAEALAGQVEGERLDESEGDFHESENTMKVDKTCSRAATDADGKGKIFYGLKFGQLQQLQCHSSFLPYLAEPVPQCAALRDLNTEGDSDEVMWFVALLKDIDRMCVRDPCINMPHRRPRAAEGPPYIEGEETTSSRSIRQRVTLKIRNYKGTAFFFGPHLHCPFLRQLQVQRGDDDFDSFLVGGGAPNLQILRYQGHLFGGKSISTPRTLVASHQVRVLLDNEEDEGRVKQLLQLLNLPLSFSPLRLSPFSSLRELHVWTLDARAVVRLAFAAAAATNPRLSRAWQLVLRNRKRERYLQLQRRHLFWLHRRQMLREQESMRLLSRQRRLYEAYIARRRRLRRFCAASATIQSRQQGTNEAAPRPPQADHQEAHNQMCRELNSMRQQLQQLQRRLEALATGSPRPDVSGSRKQQQQQQQRHQRFRQGVQRLRRLRSHHQRLVALRRLLQISVTDPIFSPLDTIWGGNELRRLDELEVARRRARQQRGLEGDFGCSRSWCFWSCHRAVAALSQLLPQLRICVVQRLRGNASSLRLLLRGLPRLEIFAVEESPRSPRRQRLVQLASSLGFTVRRGCLVIPALRSNMISWGSSTVARPFRILSRSPAGGRASASSVAAADSLARELFEQFLEGSQSGVARKRRPTASASDNKTGVLPPTLGVAPLVLTLPRTAPEMDSMSASPAGCSTSSDTQNETTVGASEAQRRFRSEVNAAQIGEGGFFSTTRGADGRQGISVRLAGRTLRCCVYSRKRRRELISSRRPRSPAPTRRHRNASTSSGRTLEDARRDRQMARDLAEQLEEQLTS